VSIALPVAISTYVRSALLTIEHLAIPWGLKKSGASAAMAMSSYGVLHGMVFPILLFPSAVDSAFASLLIPELSSANEQGDKMRINGIVTRVFYLSLLFSVAVSGIFTCFSREIGMLIYNSAEAGELIRLLSPLIPLMYLDTAVDSMLKGLGEQLYTMRVNIADAFLSVVLVVTLLPFIGIKGYVITIFLMELFNTSLSIIKLLSITNIKTPIARWVFIPLFCVIISTVLTRLLFGSLALASFIVGHFGNKMLLLSEIILCILIYALLYKTVTRKISQ
jgi:stage V sporulation protein B